MVKRIFAIILCVSVFTFPVSASAATDTSTLLGQVTAISGNNVTLAIGTQNKPDDSNGAPPAPLSESVSADQPEKPPQNPGEGQMAGGGSDSSQQPPAGGGPGGLTLTGEEKTITITDDTAVTVENKGETSTGALSDIAVGDIVLVTLSSDTGTAITIRRGGGEGGRPEVAGDGSGTDRPAAAGARNAAPTESSVLVNGDSVAFQAYTIDGNNYFKLRDLAQALNQTAKQFQVGYDSTNKAITLTSGIGYTAVGGELTASGSTGNMTATLSASEVYLGGAKINLTAYMIDGNNYFKLRDVAEALNFGVTWDSTTSTIGIDTAAEYTAE